MSNNANKGHEQNLKRRKNTVGKHRPNSGPDDHLPGHESPTNNLHDRARAQQQQQPPVRHHISPSHHHHQSQQQQAMNQQQQQREHKHETRAASPNQSPTNQNQTYHQQQQLHQQHIQRSGALQRLTADLAGLQFDDADSLFKIQTTTSPAKRSSRKDVKHLTSIAKILPRPSTKPYATGTAKHQSGEHKDPAMAAAAVGTQVALGHMGGRYEDDMTIKSTNSQGSDFDPQKDALETLEDSQMLKRFKVINLIGTGNYARVYRAMTSNGRELAIKAINLSKTSENYRQKFLPRELTILRKVSHVNICKVHEIIQVADRVFIVMQFCSRGTIADLLHKQGPLNESKARFLFQQTADAVNYMHSIDLSHRDLKVENILLDHEYIPKLTDFSYSCFTSEKQSNSDTSKGSNRQVAHTHGGGGGNDNDSTKSTSHRSIKLNETFCGTLPYLSPEIIRQIPYDSRKTDIWSLGICLYVMLNDRLPFPFNDIKLMVKKQLLKDFKFKTNLEFSDQVRDLISTMLEPDFSKRPHCYEVLKHVWFTGHRERPGAT